MISTVKSVLMLLSKGFWPDPRVEKEARALVEAGYRVEVLCWDRSGKLPIKQETGGIVLRRFHAGREGRRLLPFSFLIYAVKSTIIAARTDSDVIHCHDLDTLPQGVLAAALRRKRLVYDAHEHYSLMVRKDAGRLISALLDVLERRLVPRADLVIAANQELLSYLRPSLAGDGIVVMNCADVEVLGREGRKIPRTRGMEDKIVVFYGGSLEPQRYIPELLDAVKKDDRVILRIAGKGRYESLVRETAASCERVVYIGYVGREEILRETTSSDIVFSMLDPTNENYRIATPVKVLEAMAVGVPVLVSKGTDIADVVEREGVGLALDWSEENFSKAVTRLQDPQVRKAMGEKGKAVSESEYSWKEMKRRLLDAYSGL